MERVHVGCATWAIGAANDHLLPHVPGGNLARYAARLTAAEVNSSFHRWPGLRYFRLHGSPVPYRSRYDAPFLDALAGRLRLGDWCIFDNTASGAALPNAVQLLERLAA